jgi:phosphoribosylglycinamide formyltransferase-1
MRIGIICSSGGGVARELICAVGSVHDFLIVTDRPCGLESLADEFSLPQLRIVEQDNLRFSLNTRHFFDQQGGVNLVLLFYTRLVTKELFDYYPTFNLHPSLLPDYRGFNAIERAHADRVVRFGATLHLVDEHADHGPVVAQFSTNLRKGETLDRMRKISFAQKSYLALYLLDRFESEKDTNWLTSLRREKVPMNPLINSTNLREYFKNFAIREGVEGSM